MGKTYRVEGKEVPARYFTSDQRKEDKFVARVRKAFEKYQRALRTFLEFKDDKVLPVFLEKVGSRDEADANDADGSKGLTIYNIPRDVRVKMKRPAYLRMNDLAVQAKAIIDRKLQEFQENLPEDAADLFGLLKGMFLERKKMVYTPSIAAFVGLKNITDPDLRKAQELLRQSLDADWGRMTICVEEKRADGSWRKVG